MTTKTICKCGHPIASHTYSEDYTGCDERNCNCTLDLGATIDEQAADLAALNARVEELENAVELTLEWCGEDLPDDVKKALRNVLKGAE